mmetsp:Transcript_8119/g.22597  ORF Transcript_8119/g.22597 Transcript_8119/m.22597 type:complete len:93 (-) Transcript_8119:1350-1628(-)
MMTAWQMLLTRRRRLRHTPMVTLTCELCRKEMSFSLKEKGISSSTKCLCVVTLQWYFLRSLMEESKHGAFQLVSGSDQKVIIRNHCTKENSI